MKLFGLWAIHDTGTVPLHRSVVLELKVLVFLVLGATMKQTLMVTLLVMWLQMTVWRAQIQLVQNIYAAIINNNKKNLPITTYPELEGEPAEL
jgi:hypothetical protein